MNTTQNTKTTTARQNFTTAIESSTLDQAISALVLVDDTTTEGMMIRVALINHIENTSPAIAAWVATFYSEDEDDANWDIDYPDAILLARDELARA